MIRENISRFKKTTIPYELICYLEIKLVLVLKLYTKEWKKRDRYIIVQMAGGKVVPIAQLVSKWKAGSSLGELKFVWLPWQRPLGRNVEGCFCLI